jgi:hypothetical protein
MMDLPGTNYSETLIPEFYAYREFWIDIRDELIKTVEDVRPPVEKSLKAMIDADKTFGFEEVGSLVGLGVGIAYGVATFPVTALDGPLPALDAAWAWSTFRFTRKAVEVGSFIGRGIDEVIS